MNASAPYRTQTDTTLVRNQPALQTSSGAIWLVMGAIFVVVCLIPLGLIATTAGPAVPVAMITGFIMVLLYAALVVVRLAVPHRARRLRLMAVLLLATALVALIGMMLCLAVQRLALTG